MTRTTPGCPVEDRSDETLTDAATRAGAQEAEGVGEASKGNASAQVAILMGTYNGGDFLREQLATIAKQQHPEWRLLASDDGSIDATRSILAAFEAQMGSDRVEVREVRAAASLPTSSASSATRASEPPTTPLPTRTISGTPTG